MKFIIYPNKNNGVAVVFPSTGINMSLQQLAKKVVPENTEYSIVENLTIDNYFFDAYEYKNGNAVLNIEKAKEIQKNKWRTVREQEFEKLDLDFMLAIEKGDLEQQKIIASKKQELRDITKTELPDDLETIKEFWPNCLTQ
jgi:hypothetical protein